MATTPKVTMAAATSKQTKASTGGGGSGSGGGGPANNGLKKGSVLYIPRQVLMNDGTKIKPPASYPSKANINISSTAPSSISKMIDRMSNTENPKSSIDQIWSPLMDGIVTSIPPHLIANCSLSNGTTAFKDPKKVNVGLAMKALDEYMDKILYGSKKRSLPAFEKICRE